MTVSPQYKNLNLKNQNLQSDETKTKVFLLSWRKPALLITCRETCVGVLFSSRDRETSQGYILNKNLT